MSDLLGQAQEAKSAADAAQGRTLLGEMRGLYQEARAILAQARAKGDGRLALSAIEKASRLLELEAKLLGPVEARSDPKVVIPVYGFDPDLWPDPQPIPDPTKSNGAAP